MTIDVGEESVERLTHELAIACEALRDIETKLEAARAEADRMRAGYEAALAYTLRFDAIPYTPLVGEFFRLQGKPSGQSDLDRYISALEEWRECESTMRWWALRSPNGVYDLWMASATSGHVRYGVTPTLALASLCTALGLEVTNG